MARTKISEFSSTPGSNTDIDGINIAEGCAPSGINDAIRELMSQLKDFQAGTAGDSFNGPVGTTTAAAGAFTTLSASSTATLNTLASSGATLTGGSINNMAIGGTTAAAASVTTLTTSSTVTHNGGTANGVAYLNGSKVLTTGSALTFDGSTLTASNSSVTSGNTGVVLTGRYSSTLPSSGAGYFQIKTNNGDATNGGIDILTLSAGALRQSYRIFDASDSAGYQAWNVNGSEKMRLTNTGLGIGTSSPTNALSVSGNANITGNTTLGDASTDTVTVNGYMGVGVAPDSTRGIYLKPTALTGTSQIGVRSEPVFTSAATVFGAGLQGVPSTAATAFTLADSAALLASNAVKGAGSTITNQHGLYIADQTQGTNNYGITSLVSSGTNKFNIYASGTAANYFAGNVGIGTSSPGYKLQLTNTASSNFVSVVSGTSSTSGLLLGDSDSATIGRVEYDNANNFMALYTNGSERLRIDSSGNLGIGTSSPAQKLDVVGTIQSQNNAAVNDATVGAYNFYNSNASAAANPIRASIVAGRENSAWGAYLDFYTSTGTSAQTSKMRLDTSGNLGLGVTPSAWATLKAFEMGSGVFFANNGGSTLYQGANAYYNAGWLYKTTAAASLYTQSAGVHQWSVAGSGTAGNAISFSQVMTLDASGNLGIGTTSPVARFHLGGQTASAKQAILATAPSNPNFRLEALNGDSGSTSGTLQVKFGLRYDDGSTTVDTAAFRFYRGAGAPDGSIGFVTNNSVNATLDSSGNLLVGLTSATGVAKLQVSGPLRTTGYTVATLPAGTVGMRTYVTDALAPTFGATVAAGGAVTIPVFYNGTNWIVG